MSSRESANSGGERLIVTLVKCFPALGCGSNAKPALAENIRIQELIAEFSLRIVRPAQLNKVGPLLINRFQLRRRRGEQFPDRRPVLFPGKVNGYTRLFITWTQP